MKQHVAIFSPVRVCLFTLLLLPTAVRGAEPWDWNRQTTLPPNLTALLATSEPAETPVRPSVIRLFGMTTAQPSDPLGIDPDDFNPANPGVPVTTPGANVDDTCDWFTIAVGNDNPYLEFRHRGDPGGIGYYRVATQLQVIDSPFAVCALGVQAYTPAGLQQAGVGTGPTTVCPNLAICQHLDEGLAFHAFLGQSLQLEPRLGNQLRQRIQYGFAVQRPLFSELPDRTDTFYLFLQALGRYRYDEAAGDSPGSPAATLEVLPGLQWKASDSVWWSSAFAVPLGGLSRPMEAGHLQFSCSFQF